MRIHKIGLFWVKLAAFLCVLVMMCNAIGQLLNGSFDTSKCADTLKHLPRNSVDVLWMGSSHIFFGVIPQMLYDEHGITSTILGMQRMSIDQMYWGLKEVLRRQSPDVVVMDLYTAAAPYCYDPVSNVMELRRVRPNTEIGNHAEQMARWLPLGSPYKPFSMWETKQLYNLASTDMFEIIKMHNRYSELDQMNYLTMHGKNGLILDFGSVLSSATMNPDRINQVNYTHAGALEGNNMFWKFTEEQLAEAELQPDIRQSIDRIIQLTREKGIELVFCVVPYMINAAEEKVFQEIEELAKKENIAFVGSEEVRMGDDLLADMGHLNMDGALSYTAFWGEELSRRFNLPDRRLSTDRRYAAWRDHTGRYLSQIAARREYDTMSEYLEMLTKLDDDFLILLGFQGPEYGRFTEDDYWMLVEELGIPEDVLAQWYDTGEGTLNMLIHNKQLLASNYDKNERGGVELRWNVFGNAVSIKGGKHEVNQKRTLNSSQDGLHITVFSLSNNSSKNKISFDLTQVGE